MLLEEYGKENFAVPNQNSIKTSILFPLVVGKHDKCNPSLTSGSVSTYMLNQRWERNTTRKSVHANSEVGVVPKSCSDLDFRSLLGMNILLHCHTSSYFFFEGLNASVNKLNAKLNPLGVWMFEAIYIGYPKTHTWQYPQYRTMCLPTSICSY